MGTGQRRGKVGKWNEKIRKRKDKNEKVWKGKGREKERQGRGKVSRGKQGI